MDFKVQTQSLSALSPVKFAYKYNTEESLKGSAKCFKSNFEYLQYDAFEGFRDAALSKQNCLILTKTKQLNTVFQKNLNWLTIDKIAATIHLKPNPDIYFTRSGSNIYAGGSGEKLPITISPIQDNIVELFVSNRFNFIRIEERYPYNVIITDQPLTENEKHLQRFEIEITNDQISLKALTSEGYRYLSYGSDRIMRAIGLELNDTIVNPYRFEYEYVTHSQMYHNFDPTVREVKYYPDSALYNSTPVVDIKATANNETHLLVTCSTVELSNPQLSSANVNLAITKTNFSSSGAFNPSI